MDFHKLKLESYTSYKGISLPQELKPPLEETKYPQCVFAYVDSMPSLMNAINLVSNMDLPKDNRLFLVFKKGQKDFHRDHIMMIMRKAIFFQKRAPILASLNKTYSVFTCSKRVT
jgi:hypothetical protein